jgi:hypothetical protein
VGGGCTRETWTSSPAACSVTMRHCLLGGAGARRAYIRCRAMRSFCKVEHPLLALAFPTARLLNTLSVRHLKRPSLPRTGLFGKLERLNSACSSAKRADAVRISHTLHTHHPSLDLAYLPILVFNKACIPPCCPLHHLHAHSLSFSSVPIVAIRHNCRSLHHRELVQAQSPRRLPVLITVPLRHNKLVFLPLCTFLPTKPLIFTLQRQHSPSQKKNSPLSAPAAD